VPDLLKKLSYVLGTIWNDASNRGERGRRILIFLGWQLWKRFIRLPVIVATDNRFRIIAYPDSGVAAAFLYYRVPDAQDIAFLRNHLDGGILIDVGANVGSVSLLVADKISGAILFEPDPAKIWRLTNYRSRFMSLRFPTFRVLWNLKMPVERILAIARWTGLRRRLQPGLSVA
jgi:hypothetical protein